MQFRRERVHLDDHVGHAAQTDGDGRMAHGRVPGVADQDRVGAQQVGVPGDELLQGSGSLLRPLHDQLQVDWHLVTEGAQRRQVRQDVALAVGGAAQLERRVLPPGLIQRPRGAPDTR